MDKILTVIIPTYNMEDYLRYCLDSLLIKDNFKQLEILIINDGSKDCSSAIGHEYELLYPEVFRVIDKENGNYGSCINRGLKEAKGKYVKILDADDSFHTEHFESFVSFLVETDADLILSDFVWVDIRRNIRKVIQYKLGNKELYSMDEIGSTSIFKGVQMHAVTYRRNMLLNLDYRQTEGISYTDQQWIFIPMIMVDRVAYFGKYVYKYLLGRPGQTMDPNIKLKSLSHISEGALVMVAAYEKYKECFAGRAVQEYLHAHIIPFIKEVYVSSWRYYNAEAKGFLSDFDAKLKQYSYSIYELIGSKGVSSFMGFEYLNYWRRHRNMNPVLVRLISCLYIGMLRFKNSDGQKI